MILYNKYKLTVYLSLENTINMDLIYNIKNTPIIRINHLFKHSKKLMRSFLLLHYYTLLLLPFNSFFYKNSIKYHFKLNAIFLILIDSECYENYFIFD